MLALTFVLAVGATLLAGLLPAWRACRVTPAVQLKVQLTSDLPPHPLHAEPPPHRPRPSVLEMALTCAIVSQCRST